MLVNDEVRKCVAFLGMRLADNSFRFAGSAFFFGHAREDGSANPVFVVTAKHVIDSIRSKGITEVFLRMNLKAGGSEWLRTDLDKWFVHPTDASIDVAIYEAGIPEQYDHLVLPYTVAVTDEIMRQNEVGLGDEVFITGLFRHHHGTARNIPIVRIGNLACMAEERVTTRFGDMDAYLIEARSIGGLSGSPVFLNLGSVRVIENQLKFRGSGAAVFLLGLVHGHYDVKADMTDVQDDGLSFEQVNTGIAIIVPVQSINSVIAEYEARRTA